MTCVQALVTRDGTNLKRQDQVEFVVGFDGADSFCHFLGRLVGYRDGMGQESEIRGVQLAIAANSDDHYPALADILGPSSLLGPAMNKVVTEGGTVLLGGRHVPLLLRSCLDLLAWRSMGGRRSNVSPLTELMNPQLVLPTPLNLSPP